MKRFEWSDDLTTNVHTIDSQHHEFVARINRFLDVCSTQGANHEDLVKTFTFLTDYAAQHLSFEETLMGEFNYPQAKAHSEQHDHLRTFIAEALAKVDANDLSSDFTLKVNFMLVDWFQNHIRKVDRLLTDYLKAVAERDKVPKLLKLIKGVLHLDGHGGSKTDRSRSV